MVKVVMITTSCGQLQGHDTGLWLEEFAAPYLAFREKGYEIVVASPKGGAVPIDKGSMAEAFFTEPARKVMHDAEAIGALCHTVKLDTLSFPSDVDAIFMPGGHGPCVDFVGNPTLRKAIEAMNNAGKIVSSVCHGPICLVDCTKEDGTTPLVQGRTVVGFTNTEEDAVQMTSLVPFSIETKFAEQGATFERADDWNCKVCVDGNLITGQNPQSSEGVANAVIEALS